MATIKDVARLAGVSVATVSRVINNSPKASEASRQSVGAAMETLNYHPNANARALAQQSTETVGLVVGDVSDPFFGAMVKAVEQVDILALPEVLIGGVNVKLTTLLTPEDRLQGYYAALTESGLPCNDRLVTFAEPDESGGEQAITELLGRGRNFTAVACYNDSMAAGAMGVLNDNGIDVPREISLIGFDDVLISRYVRPRLTTVRYPIVTMATQAAESDKS